MHFHIRNHSARRALPAPLHELVEGFIVPFRLHVYRSVGFVSHKATQLQAQGDVARGRAEEYTLNPA
jgi:hypothetical protein